MYIIEAQIENVRSLRKVHWSLRKIHRRIDTEQAAGWHVVIGDNGSGKSSFVRSLALALVGPTEAVALRQDWNDWLRRDQTGGRIRLDLVWDSTFDKFSGRGALPASYNSLPVGLRFSRLNDNSVKLFGTSRPDRHVWGGRSGWFCASYGPFRRFSGGDKDYDRIFLSNPKLAAHLSVFGESVALTESLRWLQELQFKKLERRAEGALLDSIRTFVNQPGFLPHGARLHEVSSKGVTFVDGNGCRISVEELSDGYRSILSMTFEMIRQMATAYGYDGLFSQDRTKVEVPGVVLIDEVDAHLHPSWQRRVGLWFREHFPNIQFIVTTHSPLVCQAASVGTVWRLPKPGSNEEGGMVTGTELDRLLYGNILDAYSTEMFGEGVTRSEESEKRLKRLAELNLKELFGGLSGEERKEQEELRSTLPTTAHTLAAAAATRNS